MGGFQNLFSKIVFKIGTRHTLNISPFWGHKVTLCFVFIYIASLETYHYGPLILCSSAVSSIDERDEEVPTTTAVAFSMNNSQPLSRRTRLLKGDNQFGLLGLGDGYRPGSIDGR